MLSHVNGETFTANAPLPGGLAAVISGDHALAWFPSQQRGISSITAQAGGPGRVTRADGRQRTILMLCWRWRAIGTVFVLHL